MLDNNFNSTNNYIHAFYADLFNYLYSIQNILIIVYKIH